MSFIKNKKRNFPCIIICLLTLFMLAAFDVRLKVRYYTIESEKITRPVRIALVTDLHSCAYGKEQETLIRAVHRQNPDIVLLGGDICDDKIPNDNTEAFLRGIADRYPCFYVTGNHEYWSNDIDTILNLFQTYQVQILSGTYCTINVNGQMLNICGISDPDETSYTDSDFGRLEQLDALKDVHKNGAYTLLLAHRPEKIGTYLNGSYDLILSGHVHGGQWRIPGLLNGLFAPDQGFFPEYAGGKYDFGTAYMIVSRGLARESTPIPRIFNRPELVIVDLL